jgi:hypothetical protein
MPVIRIGEEQKSELDEYIENNFATEVSYRIAVAELLSKE